LTVATATEVARFTVSAVPGIRSDAHLGTVLDRKGAESLSQLVKERREK
jgi:hypothetical protein